MKKKILITIIIVIVLLLVGFLGFNYYVKNNVKVEEGEETDKIVSTIIMDINPSFELYLNKDEVILDVKALNDDATSIVNEEVKGKRLNDGISLIADNLVENGFVSSDITILLSTKGEINNEALLENMHAIFEEKNITSEIITTVISEAAIERAKEYGISESKAAYIEEMLKEKENVTFEELIDKSIKEINDIVNEEVKEEPAVEEPKQNTGTSSNNSGGSSSSQGGSTSQNNSSSYSSCNPPSDNPQENISAWCSFNVNRPQNCSYTYSQMISLAEIIRMAINTIGVNEMELISRSSSTQQDSRSSYCISSYAMLSTTTTKYKVVFDSVTGRHIETITEAIPQASITQSEAVNIALSHFGLSIDNCLMCTANLQNDNNQLTWGTSLKMNDDEYHVLSIDAMNGNILRIYQ